jgi:thymidylate synthase
MKEVLNISFQVALVEDLQLLRDDIQPNLPWADQHFEERVGGEPLNPGETWKNWPWALAADAHRTEGDKFTHTYMERYWPKQAGYQAIPGCDMNFGIRYPYGDLNDVIEQLLRDPFTRQAYLPIWFPEDTGVVHGGRVPCTLGYHWILRGENLHTTYYIRSCDFFRHFRDDLYLTARLTLWLLQELRRKDQKWNKVSPSIFSFHCVSMHCFINDWRKLFHEI